MMPEVAPSERLLSPKPGPRCEGKPGPDADAVADAMPEVPPGERQLGPKSDPPGELKATSAPPVPQRMPPPQKGAEAIAVKDPMPWAEFAPLVVGGGKTGVVRTLERVCGPEANAIWGATLVGDGRAVVCVTRGVSEEEVREGKAAEVLPPTIQLWEVQTQRRVKREELPGPWA
jgi:hypothetical protein